MRPLSPLLLLTLSLAACLPDGGDPAPADAPNDTRADAPDLGCVLDQDCARGTICDAPACVERSCRFDTDCGAQRICITGVCMARECTSHSHCPDSLACQSGVCMPGVRGCEAREDCAPDRTCNVLTGACVLPPAVCRGDADCPALRVCAGGACVTP